MKEQVLKQSQTFWNGLEQADTAVMRSVCDNKCFFVHIGGNCDLDREMEAFEISSNVAFFLTGKEERLCSILAFEISILILDLCNVHQS